MGRCISRLTMRSQAAELREICGDIARCLLPPPDAVALQIWGRFGEILRGACSRRRTLWLSGLPTAAPLRISRPNSFTVMCPDPSSSSAT